MKIEFTTTRKLKEMTVDEESEFWFWFCSLIIPILFGVLLTPFIGFLPVVILIAFVSYVLQMLIAALMSPSKYYIKNPFFNWIPNILLSPITLTYDFFQSLVKGALEGFKKKKVRDRVSTLLTKGLCPKEIEVDHIEGCIEMESAELADRLFLEIISDQLDRKPIKKGSFKERLRVVKYKKTVSGFFLIGNFISTQETQRGDGAENSETKGRVFAIHFSYSPQTEIFRVKHHTSKCISQVETENDIEDMWSDLMITSGNPSEDFWARRKSRFTNPIDTETGVIFEDSLTEDSQDLPKQQTELT